MSWVRGPLCAFDVESTGVDFAVDRIVTATVVHIAPDGSSQVNNWLAAVDHIPAEATAIHGITAPYAQLHGQSPAEVIDQVGRAIRDGWTAGAVLLGHNVAYDLTMLDQETRRHYGRPFEVTGPIADSFVLDRYVDKYRKGSRKLTAVAEHYGVPLPEDDAHDATADALAAARVLYKIAHWYPEIGDMHPRDLYRLQAKAHREQATGLQDYLRGKARDAGKSVAEVEAIVCEPTWPIHPVTAAATEEKEPIS